MGAWGSRSFDNDTACDWFYELEESGVDLLESTLLLVVEGTEEYDDAEESEAVAAAEIVATMAGRGDPETDEEMVALATSFGAPSPELVALAVTAVEKIAGESYLKDLWEDDPEWLGRMGDLTVRLVR